MNTYKRHRFPPDIISFAVWLYYRFNLSHSDVEDLLAERGITVSYESIRLWCIKFGPASSPHPDEQSPQTIPIVLPRSQFSTGRHSGAGLVEVECCGGSSVAVYGILEVGVDAHRVEASGTQGATDGPPCNRAEPRGRHGGQKKEGG